MASVARPTCDPLSSLWEGVTTDDDPYRWAVVTCAAVVLLTFIVSTASGNFSQVDKLWSIVPIVYAWIPVCDSRTILMACLATIWGVRLTWNFARRGGYKWPPWDGDEDYRWEVIRAGGFLQILTNPVVWTLFNFGFISLYQNLLLLLITAPSFVAYTMAMSPNCKEAPLNWIDSLASILFLMFVALESVADNQQYAFQTEKYRLKKDGQGLKGEYADGFCQSGLFSIVRKPNYAAEQAIWICFYFFSVASQQEEGWWWNWSVVGCLLLVFLFQTSGWFTEKISRSKYRKYADYITRVPLYVPNPFFSSELLRKND